jgi:hypothetical protein
MKLSFANFSDLLEQLKTNKFKAKQEGESRKRNGKSAYCPCNVQEQCSFKKVNRMMKMVS